MTQKQPDGGWHEFERQLAAIQPVAARVDRERLMFQAGSEAAQARLRRRPVRSWLWPLATAAACLVATSLAWRLYQLEPDSMVDSAVRPAVHTEDQPPRSVPRPIPPGEHYLDRRQQALTGGVDSLAGPHASGTATPSWTLPYRELRQQLWRLDADLLSPLGDPQLNAQTPPTGENS